MRTTVDESGPAENTASGTMSALTEDSLSCFDSYVDSYVDSDAFMETVDGSCPQAAENTGTLSALTEESCFHSCVESDTQKSEIPRRNGAAIRLQRLWRIIVESRRARAGARHDHHVAHIEGLIKDQWKLCCDNNTRSKYKSDFISIL